MNQGDTILQFQNVSRLYHQGDETIRALDRVDLTLRQGEFVAIAGPSGSGKTTLLNVSVGLDQPTEGKVWVGGQDLTGMSAPALAQLRLNKVGFIFQSYNLVPVLSAEENAELILLLRGVPAAERKRTVHQVLKEVGLEGLENRRPSELSGGQQQRVAVARAIVAEPALVLARAPALAQLRLNKVGFIFQSYNLVPVLSAEENAELILLLRGVPAAERKRTVHQVLKEVGLEGLENRRPSELSGGQQQRVAVARAIVAEPALVLADEPTANLDSETAFALIDLMEKLNQEHHTTFLFSTHDPRVMKRAKRIIHLLDGRVEKDVFSPDYA